eukprot:scaffold172604_cov41-Prasinocladus_malaysianus.AAC.1
MSCVFMASPNSAKRSPPLLPTAVYFASGNQLKSLLERQSTSNHQSITCTRPPVVIVAQHSGGLGQPSDAGVAYCKLVVQQSHVIFLCDEQILPAANRRTCQ